MKRIALATMTLMTTPALLAENEDAALKTRCATALKTGLAAHGTAFWPAMHAAEALTQAGLGAEVTKTLTTLQQTITDDQQRCGIARELARAGDLPKTALLWEILQSPFDHGHVHAAESLFKVGWAADADLTPMQRAFAQEKNPRLRMMAAAALAKHSASQDALAFLRQRTAEETNPDLLFLFGWGLGQLGGTQDVAIIKGRLQDLPDPWLRSFLEHALARLGDAEGRQLVMRNLKSDDVRIVTYAAETAGAIGLRDARDLLISLLDHSDLDTRIRAAQALLLLLSLTPEPNP
jgi:sialidase-1